MQIFPREIKNLNGSKRPRAVLWEKTLDCLMMMVIKLTLDAGIYLLVQ